MFKNFLMRKMVESKMKGMPKEEQEKITSMMEKNPELFQKIALEVQEKVKGGQDQISAAMEIVKNYKDELKGFM
ncbi:MAG: hypothetical protein EXS50_02005 [Candidatus Taylorbacteria bacterium]|nr:hypothetical protein [Candidatus Taylorbacteria bacterium]